MANEDDQIDLRNFSEEKTLQILENSSGVIKLTVCHLPKAVIQVIAH